MRTPESLDSSNLVADRIAHFEQKSDSPSSVVNNNNNMNQNKNGKTLSHRLTPSNYNHRYLDLDDIMEEEREESSLDDDSDGYLATTSPDTSFRLSGRSSSSASDHSSGKETASEQSDQSNKTNISEKLSQKSLDSGFSDCDNVSKEDKRHMKSSVVHETHATKDSKLHHVSKVYFYSVSDLLQDNSTEYEDHLTLMKNESNNTPRISSSVCEADYFDRVESPFIPITSPAARDSPFQRCPRVHTGTSSLRRKTAKKTGSSKEDDQSPSPARKCLTPSQSPFPITNGSLYSELSLNRRNKEQSRKCKSDSNVSSSTESENMSLESPYPSLNCSFPLENYGLNVSISSLKDLPYSGPVGSWLSELKNVHESECTIMLQSKPVRRSDSENAKEGITDIKERIKLIQDRAHLLSGLFGNMCREVSECSKSRLVSQIHNLTHQIQLFFLECQHQQCGVMDYSHFPGYARNNPSQKSLQLQDIKHEQEKLLYLCDSIKLSVRKDTEKVPLIKLITLIGSTFSRVVELMLGVQIKTCVDSLNTAQRDKTSDQLTSALNVMTSLALEGNNLCRLLVQYGAVDTLLELCNHQHTALDIRISSLRALGSICCVLEGIIRFRELSGSVCVVKTLSDSLRGEEERREAAGVLAQVLSPWIDGNTSHKEVDSNLPDIVISLKDLIMMSNSLETFLLCSAALANLTSMVPSSLTCVCSTNMLVTMLTHPASSATSVYILEQLVTVIVNLAKLGQARKQMLQSSVLTFLMKIFTLCGGQQEESVIKAATERTVSKAAIALARLCLDPVIADTVVEMGGLEVLYPLAEVSSSANETIRIAALAAIKTISVYSSVTHNLNISTGSDNIYYSTQSELPTSSLESFV